VDGLETIAVTKRLQNTIDTTKIFCVGAKGQIAGFEEEGTGVFLPVGRLGSYTPR